MSEVKWVLLTTTDPITASICKSLLESNGIPVFLRSDVATSLHPFTIGILGEVDVLVPESQLELSQELTSCVKTGDDTMEIDDEKLDE